MKKPNKSKFLKVCGNHWLQIKTQAFLPPTKISQFFLPISNCIEIEMEIVIDACPEKKLDLYESKISLQLFFSSERLLAHTSHIPQFYLGLITF